MKILIDIGHPAHVHYFKNLASYLISKNNEILFTCREKDITIELLESLKLHYISFGKPFKKIPGKIIGLLFFNLRLLFISIKFRPDLFISAGSIYAAQVAWILRKPHITLEDTFNMEQVNLYVPFSSCILTGNYEHPSLGHKEIQYCGYQELLYLHPKYFKPDKSIFKDLGLSENEPYIILRFVSLNASHDIGHHGISLENKIRAIKEFEKYGKVFVSSESDLPEVLEGYKIPIAPQRMHDAIAFSKLIFGESATMVSEAAVLGIPGIYLDNTGRFYTEEQQEKYGLVYNYTESEDNQIKAINKGIELLNSQNLKDEWRLRRNKMLSDKIDATEFLVWFVENWPESFRVLKENPDYQERFK